MRNNFMISVIAIICIIVWLMMAVFVLFIASVLLKVAIGHFGLVPVLGCLGGACICIPISIAAIYKHRKHRNSASVAEQ